MNKINISLLEKNNIQVSLKNKQNVSTLANENVNVNYDKNFFHRQTVSSDTWTIVHNLRKYIKKICWYNYRRWKYNRLYNNT